MGGVQLHVQREVVHDGLGAVRRHAAQLQVQRVARAAEAELDGAACPVTRRATSPMEMGRWPPSSFSSSSKRQATHNS